MQALYFDGSHARVGSRPEPEPTAGMARVRVHLAGVCNTDLELVKGYMGFRGVLGHEFVGSVESGPDDWRGQRVVGEINFACGRCESCARGLARHCPNRRVMGIQQADGALAEYVNVPLENLHRVPESVSDEQAVFTEPLAAAFDNSIEDNDSLVAEVDRIIADMHEDGTLTELSIKWFGRP